MSSCWTTWGLIRYEAASITCYATGKVAIGGPANDADFLAEPLSAVGLLRGWTPGSRGAGVTWQTVDERAVDFSEPSWAEERVAAWLRSIARAGQTAGAAAAELGRALYLDTTSGGWDEAARNLAARLVAAGLPADNPTADRAVELLGYMTPPTGGEMAMLGSKGWIIRTLTDGPDGPLLAARVSAGVDPATLGAELLKGFPLSPCQVDALRRLSAPKVG